MSGEGREDHRYTYISRRLPNGNRQSVVRRVGGLFLSKIKGCPKREEDGIIGLRYRTANPASPRGWLAYLGTTHDALVGPSSFSATIFRFVFNPHRAAFLASSSSRKSSRSYNFALSEDARGRSPIIGDRNPPK